MPAPLSTRNFAIFLTSLASLIVAAPFAERSDWLGWIACLVTLAAVVAIMGLMLAAIVRNVQDWREG